MTSTTIEALAAVYLAGTENGLGKQLIDANEIAHRKEAFIKANPVCKDALKAIEAEKLKAQMEVLEYLRQNAGYGEYTATEYRDSIELRIQSLQQQLDSIEDKS